MHIVLLEPFMTGSHAAWARQYAAHSRHDVEILGLDGKYWKWRMHGGAVTLARQFLDQQLHPDLILATDMLDLATFLSLTRQVTASIPCVLYCHENQLSYPWSPDDADPGLQRDAHYCFINYTSALSADRVYFNSDYHRQDFLAELPQFLKTFPDHRELDTVAMIGEKSHTLPLGLDLKKLDALKPEATQQRPESEGPLILWNHRWEYDKNPDEFFQALFVLHEREVPFQLAVLGKSYRKQPGIFAEARKRLASRIVHWGYVKSFSDYVSWLWRSDILPVTSIHDFFGISVVEALYCGCRPLLPLRLAYPEHVSPVDFPGCYYQGNNDLIEKMADLCREYSARPLESFKWQVGRYDWSDMVEPYDAEFEKLVSY
nr:DUF3524 domain-containing protein [uncultured Desulfuromonas sp.]